MSLDRRMRLVADPAAVKLEQGPRMNELESLHESLADYLWHIDLSTEPLTLVMASDLPEKVAMDTAMETTIFKGHNGSPIVFCAENETRFDSVAGATDSALPARQAFLLANDMLWLVNQSAEICVTEARLADILTVLNKALEEMYPAYRHHPPPGQDRHGRDFATER